MEILSEAAAGPRSRLPTEAVSPMEGLADVTTLENMAISDNDELITDGGETGVDLTESDVTKAAGNVSSVDKENEGDHSAPVPQHGVLLLAQFYLACRRAIQHRRATRTRS